MDLMMPIDELEDEMFKGNPWIRLSMAIEADDIDAIHSLIEPCRTHVFDPTIGTFMGKQSPDAATLSKNDFVKASTLSDLVIWGSARVCVAILESGLFTPQEVMNESLPKEKYQLFLYALSLTDNDYELPLEDMMHNLMNEGQATKGFPILYGLMTSPRWKSTIYANRDLLIQTIDKMPQVNDIADGVVKNFVKVLNTLTMEYAIEALGI